MTYPRKTRRTLRTSLFYIRSYTLNGKTEKKHFRSFCTMAFNFMTIRVTILHPQIETTFFLIAPPNYEKPAIKSRLASKIAINHRHETFFIKRTNTKKRIFAFTVETNVLCQVTTFGTERACSAVHGKL